MERTVAEVREMARSAPRDARIAVKQFLRYEKGLCSWGELLHGFFEHLHSGNVTQVAEILGDWLDRVKDLLRIGPRLRTEWDRHAGTVALFEVRRDGEPEQAWEARIEEEQCQWRERHWRGVEALENYFRSIDPSFPTE